MKLTPIIAGVVLVGLISWVVVASVILGATQLRPLADDYCHAARSAAGYFPSIVFWYRTWIGDLFQVAVTSLLVGVPLAHLPFSVASLIPFLATAAAVVGLSLTAILVASRGSLRARLVGIFASAPVLLVSWWAFWWVPVAIDPHQDQTPWLLATATLDWQVVNVQYVLVPVVLIAAWILLTANRSLPPVLHLAGIALLGLLSGLGGLVFGATALAFIGLFTVSRAIMARSVDLRALLEPLVFIAAGLLGLVIAYLAPGAQLRSALFVDSRPLNPVTPVGLFAWIFPQGVLTWLTGIVSPGILVVVLVGAGLAVLLASLGIVLPLRRLVGTGTALVVFSLLAALVARAGDAFAYLAFWHEVMPRSVLYVAAIVLGVAGGTWFAGVAGRVAAVAVLAVAAVAFCVALGSLATMQQSITDRFVAWEAGAAPASGPDIETDWAKNCWAVLGETRDLPTRAG